MHVDPFQFGFQQYELSELPCFLASGKWSQNQNLDTHVIIVGFYPP